MLTCIHKSGIICQAVLMLFHFKVARAQSRQLYSKCHWPQLILNIFVQYFEKPEYQPKNAFNSKSLVGFGDSILTERKPNEAS